DLPTTVGGGVVDQAVLWTGCATPQCYADCNRDRLVNVSDLICYMTAFAQRDPYANCTVDATIDVADFVCYQTKFAAGCGP
ncbi:MAG: hypothetical protein JNM80_03140, partial [Phycisphaerae bacterium]|nr:hypothetical protein [Phycisphaerae bacterium]